VGQCTEASREQILTSCRLRCVKLVAVKMTALWYFALDSLVDPDRRFGGTH
jgi:hypothetical protein